MSERSFYKIILLHNIPSSQNNIYTSRVHYLTEKKCNEIFYNVTVENHSKSWFKKLKWNGRNIWNDLQKGIKNHPRFCIKKRLNKKKWVINYYLETTWIKQSLKIDWYTCPKCQNDVYLTEEEKTNSKMCPSFCTFCSRTT